MSVYVQNLEIIFFLILAPVKRDFCAKNEEREDRVFRKTASPNEEFFIFKLFENRPVLAGLAIIMIGLTGVTL